MLRAAHEDPAVAPGGWLRLQLGEPLHQHVLHLGQRDGADAGHRAQLAEGRQHPVGPAQDHRGEGFEPVEPVSPRGLVRKRAEPIHHRQREAAQVPEIDEVAFEPPRPRRPGIVGGALLEAEAQLLLEPRQAACPPVASADDRRLDEQPVPVPGGAQRPPDDRPVVGVGGSAGVRVGVVRIEVGDVEQRALHRQRGERQHLLGLGRRHPPRAIDRRRALRIGLGHLPQRQVLREPARGELLGRARQQGEERPAGRVRGPGAPDEPGLDAGPPQGRLEQPAVDLRRPQHHRHPVEEHTAGGLLLHQTRDLHALARLPRGREERDFVAGGAGVLRLRGRDVLHRRFSTGLWPGGTGILRLRGRDGLPSRRRGERDVRSGVLRERLPRGRTGRYPGAGGTGVLRVLRRDGLEEPVADPRHRGIGAGRIGRSRRLGVRQPGERRPAPVVSPRNGREEPRGPAGEGRDEAEGSAVVHRHVEQHHRHVEGQVDRLPGLDRGRGQPVQLGKIDEAGLVELPRVLPRQRVEVGPHRVARRQRLGLDPARADLLEGRRQGPAKAAQLRDRREVPERAALRLVGGAGGLEGGADGDGGALK